MTSRCGATRCDCSRCAYRAPNEGGVYNLLPSAERAELYPGDREDVIDFCLPSHAERLLEGWYDLEGVFGNKYRWIGEHAAARLVRVKPGSATVAHSRPCQRRASGGVERQRERARRWVAGSWTGPAYSSSKRICRRAMNITSIFMPGPAWSVPTDDRVFTVNLSMIRLVPPE